MTYNRLHRLRRGIHYEGDDETVKTQNFSENENQDLEVGICEF